jgi:hypothetical protein
MHLEVIEFELVCSEHGRHKTLVPVELPRPRYCAHCFLPLIERREVRRFSTEAPLPDAVGSEVWIG